MKRIKLACCLIFLALAVGVTAEATAEVTTGEINWLTKYGEAMTEAQQQGKMLLIYFYDTNSKLCRRFEDQTLSDPAIRKQLRKYVCVGLPVTMKIVAKGREMVLLKHFSFKEMLSRPGIAIVDFVNRDHLGCNVSIFPITDKLQMRVVLNLPCGTLTQRTLIYAVRVHPEQPASTNGNFDPDLAKEAESHSQYQARIRYQGHHYWKTRSHRITAKLPQGLDACEVVAESWPGEHLVEAAIECVRSWRTSSGHWKAVRTGHPVYGYDMKRGSNGTWYATGIFGVK